MFSRVLLDPKYCRAGAPPAASTRSLLSGRRNARPYLQKGALDNACGISFGSVTYSQQSLPGQIAAPPIIVRAMNLRSARGRLLGRWWLLLRLMVGGMLLVVTAKTALRWVPLPADLARSPAPRPAHGGPVWTASARATHRWALRPFRRSHRANSRHAAAGDACRRGSAVLPRTAASIRWRRCGRWAANSAGVGAGEWRSGGSTVTEQLIKLAEPRPRTLRSKVLEAVQAWRLEQVWTKDQILAAYLNRLDYGNLNVGCVQAARAYSASRSRT